MTAKKPTAPAVEKIRPDPGKRLGKPDGVAAVAFTVRYAERSTYGVRTS